MSYKYWSVTLKHDVIQPYTPKLTDNVQWIRGQREVGAGGFQHWQLAVAFKKKVRLLTVKNTIGGNPHCEPARSKALDDYVWKDDTAVPDTRFELGNRGTPQRTKSTDWDQVWQSAKTGDLDAIDASTRVRLYSTLVRIRKDYLQPVGIERRVVVYWGAPATGKSRRAWEEAGIGAYPKDPCTKFWDGYQSQENVVIDEFRGDINIAHILRWFDRYPVVVECKYGAVALSCRNIYITSNVDPADWYPLVNVDSKNALLRRLEITHFQ